MVRPTAAAKEGSSTPSSSLKRGRQHPDAPTPEKDTIQKSTSRPATRMKGGNKKVDESPMSLLAVAAIEADSGDGTNKLTTTETPAAPATPSDVRRGGRARRPTAKAVADDVEPAAAVTLPENAVGSSSTSNGGGGGGNGKKRASPGGKGKRWGHGKTAAVNAEEEGEMEEEEEDDLEAEWEEMEMEDEEVEEDNIVGRGGYVGAVSSSSV